MRGVYHQTIHRQALQCNAVAHCWFHPSMGAIVTGDQFHPHFLIGQRGLWVTRYGRFPTSTGPETRLRSLGQTTGIRTSRYAGLERTNERKLPFGSGRYLSTRSSIPIRCALGQNPANAASRIRRIPTKPGDDMHMRMFHGLTGCPSLVEAYIEAVGIES